MDQYNPADIYPDYYDEGLSITNNTVKRSKRPRYFPSNKPQTFIKNAVTGVPYPYFVGSKDQSLLYKMVDATGTCDTDGYVIKTRSDLPNSNTNHLFYDSPEQCMNHLRLTLNSEHVKQWHDKHLNL
jgi:hypothetical protein